MLQGSGLYEVLARPALYLGRQGFEGLQRNHGRSVKHDILVIDW